MKEDICNLVLLVIVVTYIGFMAKTITDKDLVLDAIKNCSGSPSCIESTVSVFLYKRTPCLDGDTYRR